MAQAEAAIRYYGDAIKMRERMNGKAGSFALDQSGLRLGNDPLLEPR